MPSSPRAPRAGSSDAVMQTIAWARDAGFKPVPLHPRSKAAINRNYVDPNYKPPDDDLWRKNDYGVGVVTGTRHGGLVDADLDCQEAVHFARVFLPKTTAVFGRASKRESHYLYRTTSSDMVKRSFMDPVANSTLLELRADGGHQTVFPGSLHQDTGELVEWHSVPFPKVPEVEDEPLLRGARKVAVASLVARHIWHEGQRNEACKLLSGMFYYLDWTEDEAWELIEAVMSYCDDDDRTRRPTVRNTYQKGERGGKIAGAGKMRQFLKDDRLVDRLLEWVGSPIVNLLQEYNERYAVVMVNNQYRIARTDVAPGRPPTFYQRDDFLHWKVPDTVALDDKPVQKAKIWLSSPRRRSYEDVDFLPGIDDPPGVLNLWTGWSVQPSATASCSAWLDLLRDVVCGGDPDLSRWLLHWFANIVREPMNKATTAPVIIGTQGAGKSVLLSYFSRILGSYSVVVTDPEHVTGRFNEHMALALLLHSEEALYAGDRKHRSVIKSLISDEYRMYEPKNINAKQVRNFMRIALTANDLLAAPAEAGDRRFSVFDMKERSAKDTPLIRAVIRERDHDDGPAALMHYLLSMDYDPAVPRANVKNDALSALKFANLEPVAAWWLEILHMGVLLPKYLVWCARPEGEGWSETVSSTALYVAMTIDVRKKRSRGSIPNRQEFSGQLDRFVGRKLNHQRRTFNGFTDDDAPPEAKQLSDKQMAVVDMPALSECRAAFEKFVGQVIEWPTESDEEDESWEKKRKRDRMEDKF